MMDKMLGIIIAQLGLDKEKIMSMAEDVGELVRTIDKRIANIETQQAEILALLKKERKDDGSQTEPQRIAAE